MKTEIAREVQMNIDVETACLTSITVSRFCTVGTGASTFE